MGHIFLFIVSMLGLAVKQSHGAVTSSEVYWHSMLPNTPMPSAIRDHLSSVAGDLRRPFTFTFDHSIKEDPVRTARNGADAIITGPEGNPITIYRDTRQPLTFGYSRYAKNKNLVDVPGRGVDAIITGPEGNTITIHRDTRRPATFGYSPYAKNKNLVDVQGRGANAIVTGPEGNPVTIHHDTRRPATFGYSPYAKNKNLVDVPGRGVDTIVTGPEGNPVTIHHDTRRPATFGYSPYAKNKNLVEVPGRGADAIVTGTEGNPVTIHRDTSRPATFGYSSYTKNKNLIEVPERGADAIVTGPEGNPVTIHRDTRQPITFGYNPYVKNKNLVEVPGTSADATVTGLKGNPTTIGHDAMDTIDSLRIDSPSAISSFLEGNLYVGAKMEAMFRRPLEGDYFLLPRVADSVPFSSSKLPEILNHFSINPNSFEAKKMWQVHHFCELPTAPREKKQCATTLESMVDFIASSLNGSASNMIIKVLSSTTEQETVSTQMYTVESFSPLPTEGTPTVPCHLELYPYTVYHCHMTHGIKLYLIKLVGQSVGDTVEAVAMCHRDTSDWDPDYPTLRAHKVKPGEGSMCHLLPIGDFAFILTAAAASAAVQ